MQRVVLTLSTLLLLCGLAHSARVQAAQYVLTQNYSGLSFFDNWDFFTDNDPSNGYVNYVDHNTAQAQGLISAGPHNVYIGSDHTNIASGRGRSSVRLTSKAAFNDGLFIADLSHMPTGCGTWPAFWLVGPNWPAGGEIDVIEGVNTNANDQTTLHTNAGCDMSRMNTSVFTGKMVSSQCASGPGNNAGCGIVDVADNTYGAPFNQAGGGVFVMEFGHGWPIKAWFFPQGKVPRDITHGKPVPTSWGKPYAQFDIGSNCPPTHFYDLQIVINLTFCGDWAGNAFGSSCGQYGDCTDFVKNNPAHFTDAYWIYNSVKVYQYK